jgi:hypothetical protein
MSTLYDLIIVGGGAAGLRVGIETLKVQPQLKCCILEKYGYIGGRVVTFRKNIPKVGEVQWENGAGRISTSHKKVLKLIQDYKLTFVPIGADTDFINDPSAFDKEPVIVGNKFTDLINFYPNPATEKLIFENPSFEKVTILSLDGKLIAEKQLIANSINISNLDSGIYLISVNNKNGNKITKRFVKN